MTRRRSIPEMGNLFDFPLPEEQKPEQVPVQLPDWSERERALDVTQSWIVEAPAGSGKTGLLIQRYLKLLALPGVEEPEQVMAITFTLKATGEIRERITDELERASRPDKSKDEFQRQTRRLAQAVLERDHALGWNLLDHPRRFNIRTIDSVCAEIARGLPVLAGGGGLAPVDDPGPLYQLAAERTLMQLGGADTALSDALRLLLLHRDGNLAHVRELLAEMLSLRDQWGRLVPLGREMLEESYLDGTVLPQIERALAEGICSELTTLSRIMPSGLLDELSALAGELGNNDGYQGQPSPIAICGGIYTTPGVAIEDLERWRALCHLLVKNDWRRGLNRNHLGFEITREQKNRLTEIIDRLRGSDELLTAVKNVAALPPQHYPPEQWIVAKALFHVLHHALVELQLVFAERGECDFTEPALLARAALRNNSGSLEIALGAKLQHILVDEMQDTSTSQYELIELITQGWDGHSQTVFLVGDPKQSIYLFRQARVERFVRAMREQRVGQLKLKLLNLTANFRSQSGLVHSFNDDFSQLFPHEVHEDRPEEVPYVAAVPVRGGSREGSPGVVWHTRVLASGLSPDERRLARRRRARSEAASIRAVVEQWRSRTLPPGREEPWKIAVLVRNRNHLVDIVAEFKRRDGVDEIPFRAVDIEPLYERPEILDLFALTRALLHPADRIAWLAILRGPWCGLELAELHQLTGADDATLAERTLEELLEERGGRLSLDSSLRIERLWTALRSAANQHSRIPLAELVERTWRSVGGDVYLSAQELTNTRRYFELLDALDREAAEIDLKQLKRRLRDLYAEPLTQANAVDLITIHKAKGLEWDVVLIPGLEKRSRVNRRRLLAWNEVTSPGERVAHILLAPIVGKGRESEDLNEWLNRIQKVREDAECRRLFYVACTRAREELHLFGEPTEKTDGTIYSIAGTLLHAAWPAAERKFINTQVASRPLTAPVVMLRPSTKDNPILPELAAEAEVQTATSLLFRLPAGFRPQEHLSKAIPLTRGESSIVLTTPFERPEGSFEARALGNAIHTLLESMAGKLSSGVAPESLLEEIATWNHRIAALLRSEGLAPQSIDRHTLRVRSALVSTLKDPSGLWLLSAHADAASEYALTSWNETRSTVRLDRVFRAGTEPGVPGSDYLWIADFKTTPHSDTGVEEFLARERSKYASQLETYARVIRNETNSDNIRLALYYPMIPKLTWWPLIIS